MPTTPESPSKSPSSSFGEEDAEFAALPLESHGPSASPTPALGGTVRRPQTCGASPAQPFARAVPSSPELEPPPAAPSDGDDPPADDLLVAKWEHVLHNALHEKRKIVAHIERLLSGRK